MSHTRLLLLGTLAGVALFSGCKKDDPEHVDLGLAYFPTTPGRWIEYQVDSFRTTDSQTEEYHFPLREVIHENFTDPEGRPAQRIIRYELDTNNSWLPESVWWQVRDNVRAEKAEENLRRLKLIFPPRPSQVWNTNVYNTADPFELTYEEIDEPWSINGMSFDSTILVVGTYEPNPFFTKTFKERYAKNVGLIYREVDSSETQYDPDPSYDRWLVKYTVTGYGQ